MPDEQASAQWLARELPLEKATVQEESASTSATPAAEPTEAAAE